MTLSIIIVNCYQLTCWGQQTFEADTLCYEAEECNGDYSSALYLTIISCKEHILKYH